jgi:hypothetical protein
MTSSIAPPSHAVVLWFEFKITFHCSGCSDWGLCATRNDHLVKSFSIPRHHNSAGVVVLYADEQKENQVMAAEGEREGGKGEAYFG